MIVRSAPCPWPDHPVLCEAAVAYQEAGHFAWVFDRDWRIVFMSDDARLIWASVDDEYAPVAVGHHLFSPQSVAMRDE